MEEQKKEKIKWKSRENSRKIKYISFSDISYFPKQAKIVYKSKTTKLTKKQSQILDHLIENQNKTITRHDIVDDVWGAKGCEEKNFYKHIQGLREKLGDKEEPRKYIINPSMNCFALKPVAKIHYVFSRADFNKIALKTFVGLAASGVVAIAAMKSQQIPSYKSINYKPITSIKGEIRSAAASPDGSVVMYTHKPEGKSGWNLMAKRIGTQERRILVDSKNTKIYNTESSFSPSGNQIAWVKTDYQKYCEVIVADFDSSNLSIGNEQPVADCSQQPFGRTPQWRNEDSLLVSLPQGNSKPGNIIEINLITGEQFGLTNPGDSDLGDYSLFFEKTANKMAYLRWSTKSGVGTELRVFDFSNNKDYELKTYPHALNTVAWADADSILAKGIEGFEIVKLDGETYPVHSDKLGQENYPFSMGENRIGFVQGNLVDRDITVQNLATKTVDSGLSSIAHDYRAVVAKKTRDIAFLSFRDNKHQLFVTKEGIPKEVIELSENARISDMAISPDGRLIAYVQGNQLKVVNSHGKTIYQANTVVSGISFSMDNQSLLYGVQRNGIAKVRRLSINDLKVRFIAEGVMPKAAENGDIYFFNTPKKSSKTMLYKLAGRETTALFEAPFPVMVQNSNSFDIIDNELYYVTNKFEGLEGKVLVSQNLNTGEIKKVSQITSSRFSIDSSVTTVVSTRNAKVQNNLASFEIDVGSISKKP